jgi:hypothetical protein
VKKGGIEFVMDQQKRAALYSGEMRAGIRWFKTLISSLGASSIVHGPDNKRATHQKNPYKSLRVVPLMVILVKLIVYPGKNELEKATHEEIFYVVTQQRLDSSLLLKKGWWILILINNEAAAARKKRHFPAGD